MNQLSKFLRTLDLRTSGKWIVLSVIVGSLTGLAAIVFCLLIQLIQQAGLSRLAGYGPPDAVNEHTIFPEPVGDFLPWAIVGVMAVGGLISGWLVDRFAPEAAGPGTDAVIDAFHHKRGYLPPGVPLVKVLASALTLGSGGSAGRERL